MEDLLTIAVHDGSLLHLGVLGNVPVETNIPPDVALGFWHPGSPSSPNEQMAQVIDGPICRVWPVLISGSAYFVLFGEVDEDVTGVVLRFDDDHVQFTQIHEIRGRRPWMSRPEKMHRKDAVRVTWVGRPTETVVIDPIPVASD